jgi:hypothetical protein
MESVYHIVTIHVNETSWAHVWRLRSRYLGTGYDIVSYRVCMVWACLLEKPLEVVHRHPHLMLVAACIGMRGLGMPPREAS